MNKVIGFVMVGTNDLEKSSKFYDATLVHLGLKKITITERYIGYGHPNEDNEVKFYITKPYNKKQLLWATVQWLLYQQKQRKL